MNHLLIINEPKRAFFSSHQDKLAQHIHVVVKKIVFNWLFPFILDYGNEYWTKENISLTGLKNTNQKKKNQPRHMKFVF